MKIDKKVDLENRLNIDRKIDLLSLSEVKYIYCNLGNLQKNDLEID